MSETPTYFTPPQALEAVAGARPLDAIFKDPPLTFGNRRMFRYREMKSLPRGIQMQEYVHDGGAITYVGQYYNKKDQQPNSRPKRVYRVEVREMPKMFASEEPDWCAAVWEDDTRLVNLVGNSKWNVCYGGLGALRGILHKRCVQTRNNKRWRKAAKAAEKPAENKEV